MPAIFLVPQRGGLFCHSLTVESHRQQPQFYTVRVKDRPLGFRSGEYVFIKSGAPNKLLETMPRTLSGLR